MDNQASTNVKKSSKATLIITLSATLTALIMALSWIFTPLYIYNGISYSLLDIIQISGVGVISVISSVDTDLTLAFVILLGIYAVAVIWAAIPQRWSSIVGVIYTSLLVFISLAVYLGNKEETTTYTAGYAFITCCTILLLALTIAKLVFTIKDKKKALG